MKEHDATEKVFVFRIKDQRVGLRLETVQRIEAAAEITQVPGMPDAVYGVIDYHGTILPVYNLHNRLGLPGRVVQPSDKLLIINTSIRQVMVLAEEVEEIASIRLPDILNLPLADEEKMQPSVVRLGDGIVFIYDMERFLSASEAEVVAHLMQKVKLDETDHSWSGHHEDH